MCWQLPAHSSTSVTEHWRHDTLYLPRAGSAMREAVMLRSRRSWNSVRGLLLVSVLLLAAWGCQAPAATPPGQSQGAGGGTGPTGELVIYTASDERDATTAVAAFNEVYPN